MLDDVVLMVVCFMMLCEWCCVNDVVWMMLCVMMLWCLYEVDC